MLNTYFVSNESLHPWFPNVSPLNWLSHHGPSFLWLQLPSAWPRWPQSDKHCISLRAQIVDPFFVSICGSRGRQFSVAMVVSQEYTWLCVLAEVWQDVIRRKDKLGLSCAKLRWSLVWRSGRFFQSFQAWERVFSTIFMRIVTVPKRASWRQVPNPLSICAKYFLNIYARLSKWLFHLLGHSQTNSPQFSGMWFQPG